VNGITTSASAGALLKKGPSPLGARRVERNWLKLTTRHHVANRDRVPPALNNVAKHDCCRLHTTKARRQQWLRRFNYRAERDLAADKEPRTFMKITKIRCHTHRCICHALDEVVRCEFTSVQVNIIAQPGVQRAEFTTGYFAWDIGSPTRQPRSSARCWRCSRCPAPRQARA
jgi:hypothetical protein